MDRKNKSFLIIAASYVGKGIVILVNGALIAAAIWYEFYYAQSFGFEAGRVLRTAMLCGAFAMIPISVTLNNVVWIRKILFSKLSGPFLILYGLVLGLLIYLNPFS